MNRRSFEISLVLIVACLISLPARAAEPAKLSGTILKLSEITDKEFNVNVGGLVVVIVRDSGSRPPQEIKVDPSKAFQALGVVRGTQDDKGQALMGGGYNWYLFTPVTAGETTIKVSFMENGTGGKKVERAYKVKVEKRD